MRGPVAVLILILGWGIMYFLLMGAIPEHLREQNDEMPGTQKAAPLVEKGPAVPAGQDSEPATKEQGEPPSEPEPGPDAEPDAEPEAERGRRPKPPPPSGVPEGR